MSQLMDALNVKKVVKTVLILKKIWFAQVVMKDTKWCN